MATCVIGRKFLWNNFYNNSAHLKLPLANNIVAAAVGTRISSRGSECRGYKAWEWPYQKELNKRRHLAGPEESRPRSAWVNWNYDVELYCFGKRLSEQFSLETLKQIFVHKSHTVALQTEHSKLVEDLDVVEPELSTKVETINTELSSVTNESLVHEGEHFCKMRIDSFMKRQFPKLPLDGVSTITQFLMSEDKLSHVSERIGTKDLILCNVFPVTKTILRDTFLAVVGAILHDQDQDHAARFIEDFLITQLIGEDLDEIFPITNAMGKLVEHLKYEGHNDIESRLLSQDGQGSLLSVYHVGIYCDKQLIGKAPGETISIAEDMAAQDALMRLYGITEDRKPMLFGRDRRVHEEQHNLQSDNGKHISQSGSV